MAIVHRITFICIVGTLLAYYMAVAKLSNNINNGIKKGQTMKTANISHKTVQDALKVAGSLYYMNAQKAKGYAFTVNDNNTDVNCGEFMFAGEPVTKERFDGFISFFDKTLTDLESKEVVSLI